MPKDKNLIAILFAILAAALYAAKETTRSQMPHRHRLRKQGRKQKILYIAKGRVKRTQR